MAKLIHTIFNTHQEAENAKDYLVQSGFHDVTLLGQELNVPTNPENWISAFEVITSLGGSVQNDADFYVELQEYYRIQGNEEEEQQLEPQIEIIDDDAYIDSNLGYGDFELIEPYTLERYGKLVEEQQEEV